MGREDDTVTRRDLVTLVLASHPCCLILLLVRLWTWEVNSSVIENSCRASKVECAWDGPEWFTYKYVDQLTILGGETLRRDLAVNLQILNDLGEPHCFPKCFFNENPNGGT